jgi:hypothetical protein
MIRLSFFLKPTQAAGQVQGHRGTFISIFVSPWLPQVPLGVPDFAGCRR